MHAYNENYLNSAAANFGNMMDYAVNDCFMGGDEFTEMFISTGIAEQFERGNPKYIAGLSGPELVRKVVLRARNEQILIEPSNRESKSISYWAGWALCYYQWQTARPFSDILRILPFSDIIKMYPTLHEADITKFFDTVDTIFMNRNTKTNLKRIRSASGLSQTSLAALSKVSLRSIQMYEQKNKDINKAQAISLAKIARTLGCDIEDLLETN